MKTFKKLSVFMLIFIMTAVPIYGSNPRTTDDSEYVHQLLEEITSLRIRISDLEKELSSSSTPTPTPKPTSPKIKVQEPSVISVIGTGIRSGEVTVKNIGTSVAKKLLTQIELPGDAPFSIKFSSDSNYVNSVSTNGTHKISFSIDVAKEAKSGIYGVTLNHTYLDDNNKELTDTDTVYIKITNDTYSSANVVLHDFVNSSQNILPGDKFTLSANIRNSGETTANNIQVVLDGLKSDEIYLSGSTGSLYFNNMVAGSTENAAFSLTASNKVKGGTYPITFKVTYKDENGEQHENSYVYYVVIGAGSESTGSLTIGTVSAPTSTMGVSQNFNITLPITNSGTSEIKNVKIVAEPDSEGGVVPMSASTKLVNAMAAGESQNVVFSFAPTSKAESKNYTIGFTVSYETGALNEDGTNEIVTFSQYAGVNVNNPDKDDDEDKNKSVPKIIISRYQSDPIVVTAGKNYDLSITFKNTHTEKAVKNAKVSLTAVDTTEKKGNVFTPVNASNTFYIDYIPPGGEVDKFLEFYTVPDADPKNHIIDVTFEYEDGDNEQYTTTDQIGINVKQYTKFESGNLNVQPNSFVGSPASIYFEFYNTGKVTLSNLLISLEGEGLDVSGSSSYYSNFSPGYSEIYDAMFVPMEAGLQTGYIVVSYEDDTGEKIVEKIEFSVDVMEDVPYNPEFDMMEFNEEPEAGGFLGFIKKPVVIIAGVAIIVAIAVIVFLVLRRRKRKREDFDLNE